jgi:hypothetical protein
MERYMRNGKQTTRKKFFEQLEKDEFAEMWYYHYTLNAKNIMQLSKGTEIKCNKNCYQIIKDKGDDRNEI